MALIPNLIASIQSAFKTVGARIARGTKTVIEAAFARRSLSEGELVRDVIQSIHHTDPEAIVEQLHQSVTTVRRLLDTEASVVAWPWDTEIPRNLIVSGKLKSADRYRVFYQADVFHNGVFTGRQWFSRYTDTLKTFDEYAEDIASAQTTELYGRSRSIGNISFHHIIHQRGRSF